MLGKLFKYFKVVRKEAFLAIFFIMLETVLETFVPFMNAQIVDVGIANNDLPFIYLWGGLMVLSASLAFLIGIIGVRYVAATGQGYGAELRRAQFEKLQQFDAENHDKYAVSSLITRLTNDTYTIQNTIILGMRALFRAPFMIIMVLTLSFAMNKSLALIFALTIPVVAILMLVVVLRVRPIFEKMQRNFDNLNRKLQENFQAIRVVKAYVTEEQEINEFAVINDNYRKVAAGAFMTVSLNNPFMQLGLYASIIGLLYLGGDLVSTGSAKVGEITGLLTFVLQVMNALLMVAQLLIMFSRTIASSDRIIEVLETPPTLLHTLVSAHNVSGSKLELKNVSFHYPDATSSQNVLEDISFTIEPGETLGVIGQTGSGKSTLVHLLARLYDVTRGVILLDGNALDTYSNHDILQNINIVFQNNMLFSGSILDNLKWGNKDLSDEDLKRALKASQSEEIIEKLNDGLLSEVGQAGTNLSGGQKQRISLARALLREPKILILDDSLSAIDTINEGKIRRNLRKYYPNLTLIIVSQRISAIKNAQHILVLHEGKIHGAGSHETLLKTDTIYQEIYETQLKGAKA